MDKLDKMYTSKKYDLINWQKNKFKILDTYEVKKLNLRFKTLLKMKTPGLDGFASKSSQTYLKVK